MRNKAVTPKEILRMARPQGLLEREKYGMSGGKLNLFLACLVRKFIIDAL